MMVVNFATSLKLLLLAVVLLLAAFVMVENFGVSDLMVDIQAMMMQMRNLGSAGPLLVITLMVIAVVINPLPSAPIALASGAVYGHFWGTAYIIIGATSGSLIAFLIARYAGFNVVRKIIPQGWTPAKSGSQNMLTWMIFISRLIPFLSFDLISYGAGLTPITLWRFFLATLFGLIPASFLLAHFGSKLAQADLQQMTLLILIAGLVTLPPVIYKMYQSHREKQSRDREVY